MDHIENSEKWLQLVLKASKEFSSTLIIDEILKRVLHLLVSAVEASEGSIILVDENGYIGQNILARSDIEPDKKTYTIEKVMDAGLAGWVFENKKTVFIEDTKKDDRWYEFIDDTLATRSVIAFPILKNGRLLGIVTLTHSNPRHFLKDIIQFIKPVIDQAGFAIENGNLFSQLEKNNEKLKAEIKVRKEYENELEQVVITDSLTGIHNRRYFFEMARKEFMRYDRTKAPISIVIFDIDHFKNINDSYGHQAGDKVLQDVAKYASENLREIDCFARYGGEEFIYLLPNTRDDEAIESAERIRKLIENLVIKENGIDITVTVSFGIASTNITTTNIFEEIISQADKALFEAKKTGKNKVVVWNSQLD